LPHHKKPRLPREANFSGHFSHHHPDTHKWPILNIKILIQKNVKLTFVPAKIPQRMPEIGCPRTSLGAMDVVEYHHVRAPHYIKIIQYAINGVIAIDKD
jgi:hypothetical protein